MEADSTAIQTFWHTFDWMTWATVVGALVGVAAFVFDRIDHAPEREARRKQRQLEEEFGAGPFYDALNIERLTRYYVEPDCTRADPAVEREIKDFKAAREPLMPVIDRILEMGGERRFVLVLADSGMGKSSFMLNYYARNQAKKRSQRHRIAIVHLSHPSADEEIHKIDQPRKTVLFLDALDEDAAAIEDHRKRIGELVASCHDFRKVIITCRTQFFPSDEEIIQDTGLIKQIPTGAGEKKTYEFSKLYLAPLTDAQVRTYLKRRYPIGQRRLRNKAEQLVLKAPLLSARPMILAYLPDLVESKKHLRFTSDIYACIIEAWVVREEYWVQREQLMSFSSRLAVDLYLNHRRRGTEMIPGTELVGLAQKWGIELQKWQITAKSLLNRDATGNYKFSHRSFMEFFVVRWWLASTEAPRDIRLTDQMSLFFVEQIGIDPESLPVKLKDTDSGSIGALGKSYFRIIRKTLLDRGQKALFGRIRAVIPMDVAHEMIEIPEGPFLMGGGNEANNEELPQHEVFLSAYSIGKYPVTNRQYWPFVEFGDHHPPDTWQDGRFPEDRADHPVTNVTWEDARAYCEWLNERMDGRHFYDLPTEAQWEKAARGTDGRMYPWGNEWRPGHCNTREAGVKRTTPVGQYSPQGDAPYGCADMAGNVWEWCRDWYDEKEYQRRAGRSIRDPEGPARGDYRVLRGGGFAHNVRVARCASRVPGSLSNRGNCGFRVALLPRGGK